MTHARLLAALLALGLSGCASLPGRSGGSDDPWKRAEAALSARRGLDSDAELAELVALVERWPDHPLTLVALRRAGELAELSPRLALAVEHEVSRIQQAGKLTGLAAARARSARVSSAEARGALGQVVALRHENGAVGAWTLAGPFGALAAFDFEARFAPEEGLLPAEVPGPLLAPVRPTRPLLVPDGLTVLEGEPNDGDVYYLAADLEVTRPGAHLLLVGANGSVRIWLDGAPQLERRAWRDHPATQLARPVELTAGTHRLLVKLARGGGGASALLVNLPRLDGQPAGITATPAAPGSRSMAASGPFPASSWSASGLAGALAEGDATGALLAARDLASSEPEASKALLDEALRGRPAAASLLAARGLLALRDSGLDEQVARGRGEALLRQALAGDAAEGEARLALAELLRRTDRADDAEQLLAGLPAPLRDRPLALAEQARLAQARGQTERAETLAGRAAGAGGSCDALRLLADGAGRREGARREDELTLQLAACRGGLERLARHRLRRGDVTGADEALAPFALHRPTAIEPVLARAVVRRAAGDLPGAARLLTGLLTTWPADARLLRTAADDLELSGDRAAARALRERALRFDPADLTARRALALEDGTELLADVAIDAAPILKAYRAAAPREATSTALVLDAAAIEFDPGGSTVERTHQLIRVLDQEAVDRFGESNLPAGSQLLTLRTIKADGRVLEPEGGDAKGSHSLQGLEPGDFVELEYLRAIRAPGGGRGALSDAFYFADPGASVFRSSFIVRAPRGFGLVADARQLPQAPRLEQSGPWELFRIEPRDIPPPAREPEMVPVGERLPVAQIGVESGNGLEPMGRALADLMAERLALTVELKELAGQVRAAAGPAPSPEALARAAWSTVARRVVGPGGGLGDEASVVLSRERGGRIGLVKVLLDQLGVPSTLAVVRPFDGDEGLSRFARPGQWTGPLLRVELPDRQVWLDALLRPQPFGVLADRFVDREALLLPPPGGTPAITRTPAVAAWPEGRSIELLLELAEDGSATVTGSDRLDGSLGAAAKVAFEPMEVSLHRRAVEQLQARSFRGLLLDEATLSGLDQAEVPLLIRWKGRVPLLARDGNAELRIEGALQPAELGATWVRLAARTTPLFIESSERVELKLEVVAPPGFTPRAHPPVELATPFGSFTQVDSVEGSRLRRRQRLELKRGRIPPQDYPAFAAFCAAVDAAQGAVIVLAR